MSRGRKPLPVVELPLWWDDPRDQGGNRVHATRHGVSLEEIEEVVRNTPRIEQSRMQDGTAISGYYVLTGETDAGRRVTVIVQYPIERQREWGTYEIEMARAVTAYDT